MDIGKKTIIMERNRVQERNLSIFIAGSKNLKEERAKLKILANDISSEAYMQGINIKAFSFDNFIDNQDKYDKFIETNTDIFILIIKEHLGDKSKEEFIRAANSFKKKKCPEIIIFFHESVVNSDEIYGLMAEHLGTQYYAVDYSSIDDLIAKARKRIDWYIKKQIPSWQSNKGIIDKIKGWWNMRHNLLSIGGILEVLLFSILFVVFVRMLTGGNVQSIALVFIIDIVICVFLIIFMASLWAISLRKKWGLWSLLVSNFIELFFVCKMSTILHQWRGTGYKKPIYKIFDELGAYIMRCDGMYGYIIIMASVMAIQIVIFAILLSLKIDNSREFSN